MNLIHALQDNTDPNSLVSRFRRARAKRIIDLITRIHAEKGAVNIIDLGGEANYWTLFDRDFLKSSKVRITLVNPGGIDEVADPRLFTVVDGDACALPQYADHAFDLVHSNSVIEHVGDWARMEAFAAECRRLAPRYYVQKAPDMGAAMRDVQHARLLDKAQFRFLYPDAAHHDEVVAGLTKSLIAVRDPTSH